MKPPLVAITVWNPWAWGLAAGWKPYENRDWPPPRHLIGRPIAIHAGKAEDEEAFTSFQRMLAATAPREQIPYPLTLAMMPRSAIVAVGVLKGYVEQSDSPWFVGKYGFEFSGMVPIRPVPCKGAQKFWTVPQDVTVAVRQRYRETLALRKSTTLALCLLCRAAHRAMCDPQTDSGLCQECEERPDARRRAAELEALQKEKHRQAQREGRAR